MRPNPTTFGSKTQLSKRAPNKLPPGCLEGTFPYFRVAIRTKEIS
jgi:hypothetical protein